MRFRIDHRVCILVDKDFADGKTVKKRTAGVVIDVYEIFAAYLVKFEGVGKPRMISEDDLKPC